MNHKQALKYLYRVQRNYLYTTEFSKKLVDLIIIVEENIKSEVKEEK